MQRGERHQTTQLPLVIYQLFKTTAKESYSRLCSAFFKDGAPLTMREGEKGGVWSILECHMTSVYT